MLLNFFRPGLVTGVFWDYWAQFACGVALFWRLCKLETRRARRIFDASFALAFVISIVIALRRGDLPPDPFRVSTFGLLSVCIAFSWLLLLARRYDDVIAASAPCRALAIAGQFSYSLYLVHQEMLYAIAPLEAALRLRAPLVDALVLAAVIGIAWIFHRMFERPFLNAETRPSLSPHLSF